MKKLLHLFLTLSAFCAGSVTSVASGTPVAAPATKEDKAETELTRQMDRMNDAFRKLRRQAADATRNADSLLQVGILREFAASAAKLEPAKTGTISAADREKLVVDYRARMAELLATIEKLEAALRAGRNEDAGMLVAELNSQRRAGHQKFRVEEKK